MIWDGGKLSNGGVYRFRDVDFQIEKTSNNAIVFFNYKYVGITIEDKDVLFSLNIIGKEILILFDDNW